MRRTVAAVLVAMGMLAACDGSGAAGIPARDGALVATGAGLYAARCASCHGDDLRGTDRGPSHLSEIYEPGHHADAAFLLAVRNGSPQHHWRFGPMPPVDGLSDGDVSAIVAYVRDAQRRHGFEPYPP